MSLPKVYSALIVDDMKQNLMILSRILERRNIKATCVESGMAAIEAIKRENFDIIFMDIMMPEMDGIQTTTEIRKLGYAGPIIAITAAVHEQEKCLQAGMNDFVTKPIIFDSFYKKLSVWFPEQG